MSGPAQRGAEPYLLLAGADRLRLARYRAERPDILIGDGGFGTWQAIIPEGNGETVITRYLLGELLDKLDALLGGR
jgi:hypothetical protein